MITLARIKDIVIEKKQRVLKVIQYGTKTADECSPFGDDSSPLENMTAVFANTGESGEPVIIGYINENQLAEPGEKRLYSCKENGDISSYIWLKKDETIEIGGNQHNITRFTPLETGLHQQDTAINTELAKISGLLSGIGLVYVPTAITTNISQAKADDIKCK